MPQRRWLRSPAPWLGLVMPLVAGVPDQALLMLSGADTLVVSRRREPPSQATGRAGYGAVEYELEVSAPIVLLIGADEASRRWSARRAVERRSHSEPVA